MNCRNCDREIIKDQFCRETEDQYRKRLESGCCRPKCKRLAGPLPKDRPIPPLSPVSWHTERTEGVAVPKEVPERDAARLAFARSLPCCVCQSVEGVHAHHVLTGGTGTKCADTFSVSLCYACHFEVHHIGKKSFEDKHNVNLLSVAKEIDTAYNSRK